MATIFISHASRDDELATQLEQWLKSGGFSDLFIDHSSIRGGDKWADALRANAGACRVVLCLVTPNWLSSGECPSEFKAAWYMGKWIIPLFLTGDEGLLNPVQLRELGRVRAETQGVDLTPFLTPRGLDFSRDDTRADILRRGLRAAGALASVGLDTAAFETDRGVRASPFPGLTSFGDEDADAALFFGRSREIAETLEILRKMRAMSEPNPLVIFGASGSGKSSLLKAGIIPRLRREAPAWLPLRAFRPGGDPLLNFADAISRTFADYGERRSNGTLKRTLLEAWVAADREAESARQAAELAGQSRDDASVAADAARRSVLMTTLETLGADLRACANRPGSTILISIDQAEELSRSDELSGDALADYLRAALDAASPFRLAFTIRSDSLPELQTHPRFRGLEARGYDLRTLPVFRFDDVIEHPAARYGVSVDPEVTDALMEDASGSDALPLLAFALQRLWDQFAVSGSFTLADYKSMGGLSGIIEDAAERALAGQEPEQSHLPRPPVKKSHDDLGLELFVPPLVDLSDDGAAIRRVASWSEFDSEKQSLLSRFSRWRLVVSKGEEATVEVAHEALFREWPRFARWLEPERARLETLRELKAAAKVWMRSNKSPSRLIHSGDTLKSARSLDLFPRFNSRIDRAERSYLDACLHAERQSAGKTQRLKAVAAFASLAMLGGLILWLNRETLERQLVIQTQYRPFAESLEELSVLPSGSVFRDCKEGTSDCPDMVVIPAGDFWMGALPESADADSDELPRRKIHVASFAISQKEITFAEWAACVKAKGCGSQPVPGDSGWGRDDRPVINVSWDDAQEYVSWLSGVTGADYRLAYEAEWEFAASGNTKPRPPIGSSDYTNWLDEHSWHFGNSRGQSHLVASKAPNGFGLHDMHGNVNEWVYDCFGSYSLGTAGDEAVYSNDEGCRNRVFRGGSFASLQIRALSPTYRSATDPTFRGPERGFRIVRDLGGKKPIVLEVSSLTEDQLTPVAQSEWVLTMFNVDDWMSCSINGTQVADLERYGLDPGYREVGVDRLISKGTNELRCEAQDRVAGPFPCWEYNYRLTKSGETLAQGGEKRCDKDAPIKPSPPGCSFNSFDSGLVCDHLVGFREN